MNHNSENAIKILVETFGYKKGKPAGPASAHTRLIVDCRGVSNPGTARARKNLTGLNKDISKDVLRVPLVRKLVEDGVEFVKESLLSDLSGYEGDDETEENDGSSQSNLSTLRSDHDDEESNQHGKCLPILTPGTIILSFGCQAGLHRSVAIAEAAVEELKNDKIHRLPGVEFRFEQTIEETDNAIANSLFAHIVSFLFSSQQRSLD